MVSFHFRVRLLNLSTSAYRTLSADQFFTSADGNKTALEADEIITVLLVPVAPVLHLPCLLHYSVTRIIIPPVCVYQWRGSEKNETYHRILYWGPNGLINNIE